MIRVISSIFSIKFMDYWHKKLKHLKLVKLLMFMYLIYQKKLET